MNQKFATQPFEEVLDELVGKKGTAARNRYEFELSLDIMGTKIRNLRKKRGMKVDELAKKVGVSKSTISKIENANQNVTFNQVVQVFEALGSTLSMKVQLIQ